MKLWQTEKSRENEASRASDASKVSKIPRGPFRRILEYFEPVMKQRVTAHKYPCNNQINFIWPEQVSYNNPVVLFKTRYYGFGLVFKLQSGETTHKYEPFYGL